MKKNVGLLMLAGLFALFTLSACKSEAISDLEEVKEKACSCEKGDAECFEEAGKMFDEWGEKHKDSKVTGSEEEEGKKLAEEIGKCLVEGMMPSE